MSCKENKPKRVVNALKKSAVAEHLVVNLVCAKNHILKRFKTIQVFF